MDGKGKPTKTAIEQHARFIETARALGADEDEPAFEAKLAVIARQKPKGHPTSVDKKGKRP